ncbi:hypothetical protein LLG96_01345 [bacterium]|nr:hypothetical protein [bacterium]
MKKICVAVSLLLLTILWLCPVDSFGGELTIVYTANSQGKLRECGCPGDPYGGLSERVTLIKKLREKEPPFLLVDSGNMVSLYGDYKLKTTTIAKIMNLMKYDAAGIGQLEMYHGVDNALEMAGSAQFTLLSSSIVRMNTATPVFKSYMTRTIGGQTAGIISVCDTTCFLTTESIKPDFSLLPFDRSLKPVLGDLRKKVDFIIVLSHMETGSNKRLLADYPEIDIVVQGYSNDRLETPYRSQHGILVAPGARGQFVGLVTLSRTADGVLDIRRSELIPVLDVPEDKKAADLVTSYYRGMK